MPKGKFKFGAVRKILKNKKPGSYNYYLEVMRLTNRKTIPVCSFHHKLIYVGKYDGVFLKILKMKALVLIKKNRSAYKKSSFNLRHKY